DLRERLLCGGAARAREAGRCRELRLASSPRPSKLSTSRPRAEPFACPLSGAPPAAAPEAVRARESKLLVGRGRYVRVLLILAAATGGAVGCDRDRGHAAPAPASSAGKAVQDEAARRAAELLAIELSRQATEITEADLTDRDVRVRRAAARALSRISDARGRALLEAALSDEDTAVVTWAAFGLGRLCKGHEPELVRRLSLRAAALVDQRRAAGSAPPDGSELDPTRAIADALGRCASKDAERVLRGWLRGELADAAAQGLGRLAILHQPLDDATLVALLEAA